MCLINSLENPGFRAHRKQIARVHICVYSTRGSFHEKILDHFHSLIEIF
uniref:Uncharacterized protein n=1 Tax=Anguilla anguilla TaxID=7936 RepID=A0A0E9PYD2_ANGAN